MKVQKGSVTVIALIMLLFLVILGGAWTIMMTQSKTNALADEKQQQAWYAAEAGFKRAQMLINKGNPTWTNFLTAYNDIKSNNKDKFTTIDLTSGIENNNIANTAPWYAVSIVAQGTTTNLSAAPSTGTTYTITSVGQYMGERKVITRNVTYGSGEPTEPTKPSDESKLAGDNIIITKGIINFNGKTEIKAGTVKMVVGNSQNNGQGNLTYIDSSGKTKNKQDAVDAMMLTTWKDDYTSLFTSLFSNFSSYFGPSKSKYFSDTNNYYNDQNTKQISSMPTEITKNLLLQNDTRINDNITVAKGTNALLYFGSQGYFSSTDLVTVPSGSMLVIVAEGDFNWEGQNKVTNATGDIVIICNSNVNLSDVNTGTNTRMYVIASGDINLYKCTIAKCFMACNRKLNMGKGANTLVGQFVVGSDVDMGSQTYITGDNSVLSAFGSPADILSKITKS